MPFPSHDLTFRGTTRSIGHWARETGIPAATIRSRLFKFGWPVERALTVRPDRRFGRGGRKKAGAPRACPELKRRSDDDRAYCKWYADGAEHMRSFGRWGSDGAAAAYRRFQLEWAAGRHGSDGRAPALVSDVAVAWLGHCERTYRKRGSVTSEVYCNRAAVACLEAYVDEPAADFAPPHLRAVREAMVARGWVRGTVNAQVRRIVRAFAWAATEALVPPAVPQALALVEPLAAGRRDDLGEGAGVAPVPPGHVAAVLEGAHLHPDPARRAVLAAMVRVQQLTGMRPGELCALRVPDLDRARDPWRYEVTTHNKMLHRETRRVVFFGPKARAALAPFLQAAGPADPVFRLPPARKGAAWSAISPRRYRDYVRAACLSARVPVWAPNQLRHARATELMDRYEDDAAVARVLGNSPEVTRAVYADRAGETVARRIAEAVG